MDFQYLLDLFEDYLSSQRIDDEPVNLYEPINYIMDMGGKRIRPLALLMAFTNYNTEIEKALKLAYAFELFHNFTLAHDDVMDDAELRRGRKSMHAKYNLNTAILSGDAMLIMAYQLVMESTGNLELKNKLIELFSKTALEICEGQQMDMDFEEQLEVELSEYLLMIKFKTAVLLGACLKAGALLGGSDAKDADHLYHFGLNVGLAFQIKDDVLDLYGDSEGFGKKHGGDILQKKKSFLILKALELLESDEASELLHLYNEDSLEKDKKVKKVKAQFDHLNISQHAEELMNELTENAFDHLNALKTKGTGYTSLEKLAKSLLSRRT